MKTTVMTIALALASMPFMSAKSQTPAPDANGANKPAVTKTVKKHHKHSVKKSVKTPAAKPAVAK